MKNHMSVLARILLYRIMIGWLDAVRLFAMFIAFFGALFTIALVAAFSVPAVLIAISIAICFLVPSIRLLFLQKLEHLPSDIIFNEHGDDHYTSTYCTTQSLKEANALTRPFYRHEYVSDDVVEQWRLKNSHAFVGVTNSQNTLCASFGILALEYSFFQQFLKGRVTDKELRADDILTLADSKGSSNLYISGVVVRDPIRMIGSRRASVMIWAMLEYLKKVYGVRKTRSIYAIAVNSSSENLLRNCGFTLTQKSDGRKDNLNLYMLDLTISKINNIYTRIGNYSEVCDCIYD